MVIELDVQLAVYDTGLSKEWVYPKFVIFIGDGQQRDSWVLCFQTIPHEQGVSGVANCQMPLSEEPMAELISGVSWSLWNIVEYFGAKEWSHGSIWQPCA